MGWFFLSLNFSKQNEIQIKFLMQCYLKFLFKKLQQIIIVFKKYRSLNRFIPLHEQNAGISETIAYLVWHLLGQGTGHCQVVQGADGLDKKHRGYALSSTF